MNLNITKHISDLPGFFAGYATAVPDGEILSPAHNLLLEATNLPPELTNEVLKMVAGLVIAVISKVIYGWIDKRNSSQKTQSKNEKDSEQKDSDTQ